jgi:integrase
MAWIETRGKKRLVVWREAGVRHSKSFGTRDEARIFKADIEKRILQGTLGSAEDRKQPFGVYARVLFESDLSIRTVTREDRLATLRLYLEPRMGKVTMEELQPARVRAALADIHREKGAWIVSSCHRVLSRVFRQALTDGILHRNPLEGYRLPKPQGRPIRILTPAEVGATADAIIPRLRVLVLLAAWGGLRIGELGGLRREDINFENATIAVRRAVSHPAGRVEVGPPKTASSVRVVTMPDWVMTELAGHLLMYPGEYVFSLPQGGIVTSKDISLYWRRACKNLGYGIPYPRFHDLRHTAVSVLIREGAHPKLIQSRMGHANSKITMDTYGHLFPGADAGLAATLERFKPEEGKIIEL